MGFQPKPQDEVPATFEGDYEGLEITFRKGGSIAMLLRMQRIERGSAMDDDAEAIRRFGDECIVSWNLEYNVGPQKGEPVPCTGEGLLSITDPQLTYSILAKWIDLRTAVSAPLAPPSPAGSTSESENPPN